MVRIVHFKSILITPKGNSVNTPIHSIIAAYADDGSYGLGNGMPWPRSGLPGDMQGFVKHTNDAPDNQFNLLICGKKTYESLRDVPFKGKRVLLGVSKSLFSEQNELFFDHRYLVPSVEGINSFIEKFSPHRVIWIGGQSIWHHGIKVATEAHLTVAHRTCDSEGVVRLVWPLHMLAQENEMHLAERLIKNDPNAWASSYEFQVWKK